MTPEIISISSDSKVKDAVSLMNTYNISQIPIIEETGQNTGSLTAKKIQKLITDNPDIINAKVRDVKQLSFPEVEKTWSLQDISKLLSKYPAVLVKENDKYIGIITDSNFLKISPNI